MENVLLIVPCIQFGGTESVAIRYFDELKRNKKNVFILSIVSSPNLPKTAAYIFKSNSHLYKILSFKLFRPLFYIFSFLGFLKYVDKNQLVIAFGELPILFCSPYVFLYKHFLKKKNKRFVCSFRNHPSTVKSFKMNLLIHLMKHFDLITSNSFSASSFFNKRIKNKKTLTLFNPLPSVNINLSERVKKDSFFNILSISRLEKQKNIFFIIDSFNKFYKSQVKFKDIKLHIVGDGFEYKRLQNYVISNNLSKNIFFYGNLSQKEVFKMYEYCDLFIHSSKWDGIPNTVLEALYFNLPVLAYLSEKSGITDLLKFGAPIFFFKEFNSCDLFKEICQLKTLSFSDKFLYDNKIFLDNYKKQSSIFNILGSF